MNPGHSIAGLRSTAAAEQQESPEEIQQDHVSRDSQESVKDYFTAMQDDSQ